VVVLLVSAAFYVSSRYQDRWVRTESPSVAGGPPAVVYSLDADSPVAGWLENPTPTLRVSCAGGVIGLYVQTKLSAEVEPGTSRTVRLQFDDEEPSVTKWEQAANHQAMYPSTELVRALGRKLATTRRFRFAFVPFRVEAVVAVFSVYGFAEHWRSIEAACGGPEAAKDAAPPRPSPN
jgi:hypothetical protein